jgi:hypothetical protein
LNLKNKERALHPKLCLGGSNEECPNEFSKIRLWKYKKICTKDEAMRGSEKKMYSFSESMKPRIFWRFFVLFERKVWQIKMPVKKLYSL